MLNGAIKRELLGICKEGPSRVSFDEPLAEHSTISIGGKAAAWFVPASVEDLKKAGIVLGGAGIRTFLIGNGSNVLFPDEGLDGVVISLKSPFFTRRQFSGKSVTAGAGAGLGGLISECCKRGLSGLEGLAGIPGTVGGALATNASYRTAVSDPLESVKVLSADGNIKEIAKERIEFSYRSSSLGRDETVIEAVFFLEEVPPEVLKERLQENIFEKMKNQPLDKKTIGCIFRNPTGDTRKSWELIDMAGLRGFSIGDAAVSEKHANFIVNGGSASARDVMRLIDEIKKKVSDEFSVNLETEIEVLA